MHKRSSGLTLFCYSSASLYTALVLSVVFLAAGAQAEQRPLLTTHVPDAVSSGIAPLVSHVPSTQHVSVAISLPLRNEAELDTLLRQIYDPRSANFHKYLSVEEFRTRFGPADGDFSAVLKFTQANGLTVIDTPSNHLVLDVEGPAENIESAFHV